jgi:hypothetical protein
MQATDIPSAYRDGWQKTREANNSVIAACQLAPAGQQMAWFSRALELGPEAVPDAPLALREFVAAARIPPPWFNPAQTLAGCRGFHGYSELFIAAFVGAVLIEGFSTLISQSFSITGKLVDQGTNRLKQNNRHLAEIFMPGGLEPGGDGWKLSVRIRLMHARVRFMLANSPEWDTQAWGEPLCAAQMAYATAAFSGGLLEQARKLGAELTPEEEASFMMIWRYSGHLMGVPEELQVATKSQALEFTRIGRGCEPTPDLASIQLSNGLINSAPIVAGITHPASRRRLVRTIYRVSRALIGDTLADQLRYPPSRTFGALGLFRLRTKLDGFVRRWIPRWEQYRRLQQFELMLSLSTDGSINYRMPQYLHAEKDQK